MIYCGYPCIGKSSVIKEFSKRICGTPAIDLESSLFKDQSDNRLSGWAYIYAKIAKDFSDQGYIVFCCSHAGVRFCMDELGIEYVNIYPGLNLKDAWINKAVARLNETGLEKDRLAMNRILDWYEKDIKELASHGKTIELTNSKYNLYSAIIMYQLGTKDKMIIN